MKNQGQNNYDQVFILFKEIIIAVCTLVFYASSLCFVIHVILLLQSYDSIVCYIDRMFGITSTLIIAIISRVFSKRIKTIHDKNKLQNLFNVLASVTAIILFLISILCFITSTLGVDIKTNGLFGGVYNTKESSKENENQHNCKCDKTIIIVYDSEPKPYII